MKKKLKLKRNKIFLVVPAVIFLDQITKIIALNFFNISCNSGLAFGFNFGGFLGFLIPFLTLVILLVFFLKERNKWVRFSLALILGGGFSNLFDRVLSGCVKDFISFWKFPNFNFADSVISFGVISILFFLIFKNKSNEV